MSLNELVTPVIPLNIVVGNLTVKGTYKGPDGPGFTGPQGSQGVIGPTGNQGAIGFGLQGFAGPQGSTGGLVGPQGYQGYQGTTGQAGSVISSQFAAIPEPYSFTNTFASGLLSAGVGVTVTVGVHGIVAVFGNQTCALNNNGAIVDLISSTVGIPATGSALAGGDSKVSTSCSQLGSGAGITGSVGGAMQYLATSLTPASTVYYYLATGVSNGSGAVVLQSAPSGSSSVLAMTY
jgi:hypothetical protein